ncbi:MAG: hypothetical protein OEQ53_03960, partial [Saprospiraceae bacterium]|nr:hypothetical protein [Saprospiraceae bacterium]
MNRRSFLKTSAVVTTGTSAIIPPFSNDRLVNKKSQLLKASKQAFPLAITMWEFSWLERRWPGAGYENWDQALTELVLRGYDAVRIDAFPHLVAAGPQKKWSINPHWDNQEWGSPYFTEVQVQPMLNEFIRHCKKYGVRVGLSTWWREDIDETAKKIKTPENLGTVWKKTLESIEADGLLDNVIFVDLSNEYPISVWTPYLPEKTLRNSALANRYAHRAIDLLKKAYPDIPFCLSITTEFDMWQKEDTSMQDLLEFHIWIANCSEFNKEVGYNFQRFGNGDYKKLQLRGEQEYRKKEKYYLT